jgi:hypothetical protein
MAIHKPREQRTAPQVAAIRADLEPQTKVRKGIPGYRVCPLGRCSEYLYRCLLTEKWFRKLRKTVNLRFHRNPSSKVRVAIIHTGPEDRYSETIQGAVDLPTIFKEFPTDSTSSPEDKSNWATHAAVVVAKTSANVELYIGRVTIDDENYGNTAKVMITSAF